MSKPIFEMLEQRQFLSVSTFGAEIAEGHHRSHAATFANRDSVEREGREGKRSGRHHEHSEHHSGEHQGHEQEDNEDEDGGGGGTIIANVAPSFTAGPSQTVVQDSGPMTVANWATNISAGPASEAGQKLTFVTSTDNNALFATLPAISSDGTLTYASAPGKTGTANVTVTLKDSGGTANGGKDTSAAQTFKIDVTAGQVVVVNQSPSFKKGANQTVVQDSGPMTVANWATNISAGPASEAGQKLTFVTSTDNDALFATLPAISSNGTLTYAAAPGVTGIANVTVTLKDSGGTANGGVDTSAAQTFTIEVKTGQVVVVNQAPSFTKGANQSVPQDSGAQTVANWATNISAGPASEAAQSLTFLTSTNNDALFAVTPSVAPNGALTYTPAAGATGSVTVTVKLRDNGGTANGGVDTSASQTFTINLTPVAPTIPNFVGTYNGKLVIPAVGHNKTAVLQIDAQGADGSFTGSLTSGSVMVVVSGKMAANGSFSMNLDIPPGTSHSGGSLSGTGTGVVVSAGQPMTVTLSFSGIPGTLTVTKA